MELQETSDLDTIAVRVVVPVEELSEVMGSNYEKIMAYLGREEVQPSGPPFAMYHNMDMSALEVDIGFPVPSQLPGSGDLTPGRIPGGRAVVATHEGSYETINETYDALMAFVEEKGLEMAEFSLEFYLNDPRQTPPDDLRTEIRFPVKG